MSMLNLLGLGATLSAFAVLFGLATQVIANYKAKTCGSQQMWLFGAVALAYAFWTAYGAAKGDWFLVAANAPGIPLAAAVCWQIRHYRQRRW
jgi:hypothetical protein